jgi:hypothetical protein
VKDGVMDVERINRDLAECYAQTLWMKPEAYLKIIESLELTAKEFHQMSLDFCLDEGIGRLIPAFSPGLICTRRDGIQVYADVTTRKLDLLRASVSVLA